MILSVLRLILPADTPQGSEIPASGVQTSPRGCPWGAGGQLAAHPISYGVPACPSSVKLEVPSEGLYRLGVDKALPKSICRELLFTLFLTTVKAISSVTFSGFPGALREGEPARQSINSNASYRSVPPWSCDSFFLPLPTYSFIVLPNKKV